MISINEHKIFITSIEIWVLMIIPMSAANQTAPQGGQVKHVEIIMKGRNNRQMTAEQVPERLPAMKNSVDARVD